MTMVFAFTFSDHEYFTNRCMSLGIFNQINQIIFVLETKKISMRFSCLCIVTGDCKHLFNVKSLIYTKSKEKLNISLKNIYQLLFNQKSIIRYLFDPVQNYTQ